MGTDAAAPDAPASGADAAVAGCASDDDCPRFSSREGCECRPLLESDPDPVCETMEVTSLVDPCETAGPVRCDMATGACELE